MTQLNNLLDPATLANLLGKPQTNSSPAPDAKPDFVPAQFWANFGYSVPYVNPETGEEDTVFISIDKAGVPLDTLEADTRNYKSANMKNIQSAKNELLSYIQQITAQLEPGQSVTLPVQIQVEIRRVADSSVAPEAVDPANNPFSLAKLLNK